MKHALIVLLFAPIAFAADAKHDIESAMQRYTTLLRTGPPSATAEMFTADGQLLEPGMDPLRGPDAIRKFLEPAFAAYDVKESSTKTYALDVYGDTAYQWGTYHQRVSERGKKPSYEYKGRYVAEWHRGTDGKWRMARMLVQPYPPVAK